MSLDEEPEGPFQGLPTPVSETRKTLEEGRV